MNILTVSNIRKSFGTTLLFSGVSFMVNDGDRLALIGDNGSGKSTILHMILNQEEISCDDRGVQGTIVLARNCRIGYLSQDVISSADHTLLEEASRVFADLIAGEKELEVLSHELALHPDSEELLTSYGRKAAVFEAAGGYTYRYRVTSMLYKFNFHDEDFSRPITSFSGGERTKLAFAILLLQNPDLLVLDEPTNHLDVTTIDWLENYLKTYKGALLFVSHDRYFINNVATSIYELDNQTGEMYVGNFDYYLQEKKARYEIHRRQYMLQQKEIEKMERFIAFYKPKPRFVSRAKDREKKLARIERINMPKKDQAMHFSFAGDARADKKILQFIDLECGYDNSLTGPISLLLFGQDKMAIVGDNGVGKTTLLKTIDGLLLPISGRIRQFRELKIGYLRQNDFEEEIQGTPFDYLSLAFPLMKESEIRKHLGRFSFRGDDVFKDAAVLSGGEKMRLILAKIVLCRYDLLLLDEPTNHLDLTSREALIEAMESFEAAIIFVSHDRYFIDTVANKILYLQPHRNLFFNGSYAEFRPIESTLMADENQKNIMDEKRAKKASRREKRHSPGDLDKRIKVIEKRLEEIKQAEYLEENYMNADKMKELEGESQSLEQEYLDLLEESDKSKD